MKNKEVAKNTTIILDHPQMGENIGACARAMLNFGLTDLRLVAPRDGWPNPRAIDMAVGAFDIMPPPQIFERFEDSIADCHFTLATTARPRDMVKPVYAPPNAAQKIKQHRQSGEKTALIFGAERTGLTNETTALCSGIINIPTNPDFPSLNLGQAVLLMASELQQANAATSDTTECTLPMGDNAPATQDKLHEFLQRLESELEIGLFFRSKELKPTMINNIRNMFTRANLSDQELRTLHGVLSALTGKKTANKKAAR